MWYQNRREVKIMTEISNERIGGFGFHALRHWHGEYIRNVFEGSGVWEFLRTNAVCRSHDSKPVPYTPSISTPSIYIQGRVI